MNDVLGHDSARYWARITWANEMNFITNHAPGAGSLAQPVIQQSSELPLYYGHPLQPGTTYSCYYDTDRIS